MFDEIESYIRELRDYYDGINKFNSEGLSLNDPKRAKLDSSFKDKIRKYLPSALGIIDEKFNCKFSLYKEGQDYSATFKVVPTKIKKEKLEILNELMSLERNANLSNLTDKDRRNLDLALEIIIVYADDNFNKNIGQSKFLNEALALPSDTNNFDNNIQEQPNLIPHSTDIQFNPYANEPVNIENNYSKTIDTNSFNNSIGDSKPMENNISNMDTTSYSHTGGIDGSTLSIFGSNPNINNK